MRRFIYLDTEVLNSYIAQIEDGLLEKNEVEVQTSSENTKSSSHQITGEGTVEAKIFGKGVEGKLDYAYQHLRGTNNVDLIRDVQTKIIHDNAFDQLVDYLIDKGMLNEKEKKIGDFIEVEDDFFVLDLEYYQKLFGEGGFVEYLQKIQAENIRSTYQDGEKTELNREQRRNNKSQINAMIKEDIEKNNKEYEEVNDILHMFTSVVPYKRMLCIGDLLVVLNDEFCRDKIEMLSFKYGGKIKMLGYITNKIIGDEEPEGLSAFAVISNQINTLMKVFFDKQQTLFVVHPVGIYYE